MTWHFCAVYGCNNGTREKVACVRGCKQNVSARICGHPPKRPDLLKVQFHPFPAEKTLRKAWFLFLKRKDLKLKDISRNYRVCSIHFSLGLGYCKADPIPSVYNCKNLDRCQEHPSKRKAPRDRETQSTPSKRMKKSVPEEITKTSTETSKVSEEVSENCGGGGDESFISTVILAEHNYCSSNCSVGSQTFLTSEDLDKLTERTKQSEETLENKEKLRRELFMMQVLTDDKSVRFYTGLPSRSLLVDLFALLEPVAQSMRYWHGPSSFRNDTDRKQAGRKRKLTSYEEFVLVLVKLRLGLTEQHLADSFGVTFSTVSKLFKTWINLLYYELIGLIAWPSRELVEIHRPQCFARYPRTRVVIDCSEFQVEKPKTPTAQRITWSEYKQRNTVKCLFGISPSGAFTFVSNVWSGSVSDREITQKCGFLDLLEPGDDVMADRGFKVRDLLLVKKCTLNIPPSTTGKPLSRKQVTKTRRIASARIHVERAIERIKNFKILQGVIPLTLKPVIDQIVVVCAALCNMYPKLAK